MCTLGVHYGSLFINIWLNIGVISGTNRPAHLVICTWPDFASQEECIRFGKSSKIKNTCCPTDTDLTHSTVSIRYLVVSWNRGTGTPKSSIWLDFPLSTIYLLGTPILGNLHLNLCWKYSPANMFDVVNIDSSCSRPLRTMFNEGPST